MNHIIKDAPCVKDCILVVDDDPDLCDILKDILVRHGAVDIAHNGEQGLERLFKQPYSLVVSDVAMPIMNGISFYRCATQMFPATKGKFMFLTGELTSERLAFFQEHAIPYFVKPANAKDIRAAAAKILQS
ncbi:MAG: response regulator [Candidatus Riflebacteria bacterium]|nr:response regulator [Candidatus Riflebacteria bacterium]